MVTYFYDFDFSLQELSVGTNSDDKNSEFTSFLAPVFCDSNPV